MTRIEKAKLLDSILLKFNGNLSYSEESIHERSFYESINSDFYVVENHLNFLVGDEVVKKIYRTFPNAPMQTFYCLTERGFAVMTDLENLGYVSKEKERLEQERIYRGTYHYAKWAVYIAIISAILTVIGYLI